MSNIYLLSNVKSNNKDVINYSVFDIKYIDTNIDFNYYDALIFTSKNAIYALEYFNKDYKKVPSYAIAKKTANILKDHNANLVYTGISGHGDEFANEIKDKLKNKTVLYIRAKKVVSNLTKILNCDEIVVYETVCKENNSIDKIPKNSKIIFTSPSTIKCFFKNNIWDDSYIAICIGKTTASYLPKNIKYLISKQTSIDSCIEEALNI